MIVCNQRIVTGLFLFTKNYSTDIIDWIYRCCVVFVMMQAEDEEKLKTVIRQQIKKRSEQYAFC